MDLDELIASIEKHFSVLFEKYGFRIYKAFTTGQYDATMPIILKSGQCKIRIQAEETMVIGVAFGIEDSDDAYLGYCPDENWWSAESLNSFLNEQPIDQWNSRAMATDEGVADLANRYELNLEKMIEMMQSPQNWREDFDMFYEREMKRHIRRLAVGLSGSGDSWVFKTWLGKVWLKSKRWSFNIPPWK